MTHRTVTRWTLLISLALPACGGSAPSPRVASAADAQEQTASPAPPPPEATPDAEPLARESAPPEPAPPPEPEPVEVEAGARLGPIRIGMSESEVRELGLEEVESDEPGSVRFGPYRVFFDAHGARRIESRMAELGRIRVGDQVIEVGTDIHRIRDLFGHCEWYEGGGERYRCEGGTLFVHTTHSMDPARYTIAVQRR